MIMLAVLILLIIIIMLILTQVTLVLTLILLAGSSAEKNHILGDWQLSCDVMISYSFPISWLLVDIRSFKHNHQRWAASSAANHNMIMMMIILCVYIIILILILVITLLLYYYYYDYSHHYHYHCRPDAQLCLLQVGSRSGENTLYAQSPF